MQNMTPRERVMAALNHEETDRIPFSWGFGINDPALIDLKDYLNFNSIEETKNHLSKADDILQLYPPKYIGPKYRNCKDGDEFVSIWGYKTKFVSYGVGGYDEHSFNPLADMETLNEIKNFEFPSADWFDFSDLENQIDSLNYNCKKAVRFNSVNPFETSSWMRGFENFLLDTAADPEIVHYVMRKTTDFFLEYIKRAFEASNGKIDILFSADDLGSQTGLLLSPNSIREFITPYHKELNAVAHKYGAKVMYHSCGSVILAVEDLIDCGIDVLESLQFYTAGMTPEALKDNFGDRLCFHGGVSVQKTLVTGTPEDVTAEVEHLKKVLGKNGGYILAPAHKIQAGTSPENIVAMLKAAGRFDDIL